MFAHILTNIVHLRGTLSQSSTLSVAKLPHLESDTGGNRLKHVLYSLLFLFYCYLFSVALFWNFGGIEDCNIDIDSLDLSIITTTATHNQYRNNKKQFYASYCPDAHIAWNLTVIQMSDIVLSLLIIRDVMLPCVLVSSQ